MTAAKHSRRLLGIAAGVSDKMRSELRKSSLSFASHVNRMMWQRRSFTARAKESLVSTVETTESKKQTSHVVHHKHFLSLHSDTTLKIFELSVCSFAGVFTSMEFVQATAAFRCQQKSFVMGKHRLVTCLRKLSFSALSFRKTFLFSSKTNSRSVNFPK